MRVLGLVPARGGSKGVPRKNIRLLVGKPLLAYTAEAALAARSLERVILSTDSEEIAEVGRAVGLDVPFLRPAELARDETPTLPVVQHALAQLDAQAERYDAVCLLQPTDPLRSAEDIEACVALLKSSGADSVISVLEVPARYNPHWVYLADERGGLSLATGGSEPIPRRQALPPAYHRSGSVYLTRADVIRQGSLFGARVVGWHAPPERAVNIDTEADFALAERILSGAAERT